jgi:peptide chain release factor 1
MTVKLDYPAHHAQNKRRAFQVLTARLLDLKLTKEMEERRTARRKLISTADRSEKIRTYNYAQVRTCWPWANNAFLKTPIQERVTDHRIGLTIKNLSSVMEGEGLQDFIDALQREHHESMLENTLTVVE